MRVMVGSSSSCQRQHGGSSDESSVNGGDVTRSPSCKSTPDSIAPRRQAASPSSAACAACIDASTVAVAGKSRPCAASSTFQKSRRGKRSAARRSPSPLPDRSCRAGAVSSATCTVANDGNTIYRSTTSSSSTDTAPVRPMTPTPNGVTGRSHKSGGRSPRSSVKSASRQLKVSVPTPSSLVGGRASAGPFFLPRSGGRRCGLVRRTHSPKTVVSLFVA